MGTPARTLASALEPVIGAVYFAPEAHAAYVALGYGDSPAGRGGVAFPDGVAYATSRGSLLGAANGATVAAAFGVFEPTGIAASVDHGRTIADAATILAAREDAVLALLSRIVGSEGDRRQRAAELLRRAVDGLAPGPRALAAGALVAPVHDHAFGEIFRWGDALREFRGDSHNAAWAAAGLDACQIGILSELWWGLPARSYSRTRGWSAEQFDAAVASLTDDGYLTPEETLSDAGRAFREEIEVATDAQMTPVLDRLGSDLDELVAILEPWGATIRAGHGYPASGPHDLAGQ